eukprot:GFYU01011809.1.p2 GENE.GFYU01011809.1~~GFYU01011809.1.p2  ORF type:complete len:100 (-),score=35.94 GFYU01011809.1:97-396(-)
MAGTFFICLAFVVYTLEGIVATGSGSDKDLLRLIVRIIAMLCVLAGIILLAVNLSQQQSTLLIKDRAPVVKKKKGTATKRYPGVEEDIEMGAVKYQQHP